MNQPYPLPPLKKGGNQESSLFQAGLRGIKLADGCIDIHIDGNETRNHGD
ncbi:hypothetical protein [Microcystis sp. LE18-22.4A]|nr:hypothetical protein [Microcystis sp. LE18-22.4A]